MIMANNDEENGDESSSPEKTKNSSTNQTEPPANQSTAIDTSQIQLQEGQQVSF